MTKGCQTLVKLKTCHICAYNARRRAVSECMYWNVNDTEYSLAVIRGRDIEHQSVRQSCGD